MLQVGNAPCLPLLLRVSSELLPDMEDDMGDLGMIGEKLRAVDGIEKLVWFFVVVCGVP